MYSTTFWLFVVLLFFFLVLLRKREFGLPVFILLKMYVGTYETSN